LKEDHAASARAKGDIVGLDFDPYIGGNAGPIGRYVVRGITQKAGHYLAKVYTRPGVKPVVAAEVAFKNGRWLFVNFHYYIYEKDKPPALFDLLTILKELREQRRKLPRPAGNVNLC
jgi:hypothetical protein